MPIWSGTVNRDLLRVLRNDLPMEFTLRKLGPKAPYSKLDGARLRFICPHCNELLAAVNPRNNLAHCFRCGRNINNIDLLLKSGYGFRDAVAALQEWLRLYRLNPDKVAPPTERAAIPGREAVSIGAVLKQTLQDRPANK